MTLYCCLSSQYAFLSLYFSFPVFQTLRPFWAYKVCRVFFNRIFLLGHLTLLSCILPCNTTFYYFRNNYFFFFFSIWVNLNHICLPKKSLYNFFFCCEFCTYITWFGQKPVRQMPYYRFYAVYQILNKTLRKNDKYFSWNPIIIPYQYYVDSPLSIKNYTQPLKMTKKALYLFFYKA